MVCGVVNGRTDTRPSHYAFRSGRDQRNTISFKKQTSRQTDRAAWELSAFLSLFQMRDQAQMRRATFTLTFILFYFRRSDGSRLPSARSIKIRTATRRLSETLSTTKASADMDVMVLRGDNGPRGVLLRRREEQWPELGSETSEGRSEGPTPAVVGPCRRHAKTTSAGTCPVRRRSLDARHGADACGRRKTTAKRALAGAASTDPRPDICPSVPLTTPFFPIYTVRHIKRNQFSSVYIFFNTWQKLVNFFHTHHRKYKLQLGVFNYGMH